MEKLNASVERISGNYDESLQVCIKHAEERGWSIISDTSYEGYTKYPAYVMAGYTVMAEEVRIQIQNRLRPTHVFLQGGVGAFPAAICAYFWEKLANPDIKFVIV